MEILKIKKTKVRVRKDLGHTDVSWSENETRFIVSMTEDEYIKAKEGLKK